MNKKRVYESKPCVRLGELVEAQFDAMDRNLGHITPRNMRVYNTIVGMVKLSKEGKPK